MPTTTRTLRVYVRTEYDTDPDLSWLDQTPAQLGSLAWAVENRRRKNAYERGDWYMLGVRLAAEITLERDGRVDDRHTLTTPGVWGVESDSGDDYFRALALDDAGYLRDDLLALGFTDAEIEDALAEVARG